MSDAPRWMAPAPKRSSMASSAEFNSRASPGAAAKRSIWPEGSTPISCSPAADQAHPGRQFRIGEQFSCSSSNPAPVLRWFGKSHLTGKSSILPRAIEFLVGFDLQPHHACLEMLAPKSSGDGIGLPPDDLAESITIVDVRRKSLLFPNRSSIT